VQRRREIIERRSAVALRNGVPTGDPISGDRMVGGMRSAQRNGSQPGGRT
jgi:hypothetical protein